MRAPIRYAGFDPREDDFSDVGLAPLHSEELRSPRFTVIDTARAWQLKNAGMNWNEIGIQLAEEAGRRIQFTSQSVYAAAMYGERRRVERRTSIGGNNHG